MQEMEPCRIPEEDWCRNQPNVMTPQRRDVPTSRRHNITTSQRRDGLRERLNKPYLLESYKRNGESNFGGSKFVFNARV